MTHTCKKCGESKPAADMLSRSGKVQATCKACYAESITAGRAAARKAGGGSVKTKAKRIPRVTAAAPVLAIAAGFGIEASLADNLLQLAQRNTDGEVADTIALTRSEARALFEKFWAWATGVNPPPRLQAVSEEPHETPPPVARQLSRSGPQPKPHARLSMSEEENPHAAKLAAGIAEMRESFEKKARGLTP